MNPADLAMQMLLQFASNLEDEAQRLTRDLGETHEGLMLARYTRVLASAVKLAVVQTVNDVNERINEIANRS